jgi:hypothetical protein
MGVGNDPETDQAFRDFEATGQFVVERNLSRGVYPDRIRLLAEQWLEDNERSRHDRFSEPDRRMAKSAKIAAWLAAIMAMIANVIAIAALVIAYLALKHGYAP